MANAGRRPRPPDDAGESAAAKRPRLECPACDLWAREIGLFLASSSHHSNSNSGSSNGVREATQEEMVYEAYRVLRACWLFSGRPQDAFEPARHIHRMAQRLLTTYGGHCLTGDGQYLVVRGEGAMPFVGFLLVVLQRLLLQYGSAPSRPFPAAQRPSTAIQQQQSSFGVNEWRMVAMDCHYFGWAASDDFDSSQRRLLDVADALRRAMAPDPSQYQQQQQRVRAVVLLGGCVVTSGGADRLAEALRAECCFVAHYQYGRGIACLIRGVPTGSTADDDVLARAVNCGERRTRRLCAHAVLLSPAGPLVLHVQHHSTSDSDSAYGVGVGGEEDEAGLCAWLGQLLLAPQPVVVAEWGGDSAEAVAGVLPQLMRRHGRAAMMDAAAGFHRCPTGSRGPLLRARETAEVRLVADGTACHAWRLRSEAAATGPSG